MNSLSYSESVSPAQAYDLVQNQMATLIDVRGLDEFVSERAAGAVCIPLPDLERRAGELSADRPVLVMCQSGGRSALAAERLRALGIGSITDVQGGLQSWRQAGLPTVRQTRAIALERQVRIAAGLLVLCFCAAGFAVHPLFFVGAAIIGFMLTLTGALGICPMMSVLRLLPWNRVSH